MATYSPLQPNGQIPSTPSFERLPPKASRRRDKPQLSCSLCRRRKLRCDRKQPCESCVKRGQSCTYAASSDPCERVNPEHSLQGSHISTNLHNRISELERLVRSQITRSHAAKYAESQVAGETNSSPTLPLQAEDPRFSDNIGRVSVGSQVNYAESVHLSVILDKIKELKEHCGNDSSPVGNHAPANKEPIFEGPELLFGGHGEITKEEILAAIPERQLVDVLIAKCFDNVDTASVIIHRPTFLREYENFWEKPLETPTMWFGMLFGMMCAGALQEQWSPNEAAVSFHRKSTPDSRHLISRYREKIIQCLILGGYTEPSQYTIETLLLYLHAEYVRSEDNKMGNWVLLGIIIRLAYRMGYHSDGSQSPQLSPFQAEMRRRVWTILFTLDVSTSAQVALPRMIKDSQCNSAEPRNLMDEDFDESMTELPDARSDMVHTPVQFTVTNSRIAHVFGMVSDLTTSTPACSYGEIMVLDKVLRDTYNAIPECLAVHSMVQPTMESPKLIMRRIHVAVLFHKARSVLHRKYLFPGRTEGNYIYSRATCIEAALQILEFQRDVDQKTQVGGQLYQDRWKISSILKHDFLFATTLLGSIFDHSFDAESYPRASENFLDIETRESILKVLNESCIIWLRWSDSSSEAQKAIEILRTVLDKTQRLSTGNSINMKDMPDNGPSSCDESLLRRPIPINFFSASRRLRGPMVLPPPIDDPSLVDVVEAPLAK